MTIEYKEHYIIISADEGMVLTEWQEGDDILDYSYAIKQYTPLNYDINKLREISLEENIRLVEEQEERIKELNEVEDGKNI